MNNQTFLVGKGPSSVVLGARHISNLDELPKQYQEMYSRMKYSDPIATQKIAVFLTDMITTNEEILKVLREDGELVLTSSAFGEVPTAANSVMQEVLIELGRRNIEASSIKIDRFGDFGTTSYGKMNRLERLDRMKARKISIDQSNRLKIQDKFVIIVDDVRVTGSHEKTLDDLLKTTSARGWAFVYGILFSDKLSRESPETEQLLNSSSVSTPLDLIPFFKGDYSGIDVRINARTIKFILSVIPEEGENLTQVEKIANLKTFLINCSDLILTKLFNAAHSSDGYYLNPKFTDGFNILLNCLVNRRVLGLDQANKIKRYTVIQNVTLDLGNNLVDMNSGEQINELGERFSRVKFGHPDEIDYFGKQLAFEFIRDLSVEGSELMKLFVRARRDNEFIVMLSPASRNIESPANFIAERVVSCLNPWLTRQNLPTIILVKMVRLLSGNPDYAKMSEEARIVSKSKTGSIMPGVELFDRKVHTIFCDDIRITGITADRVERTVLSLGSLSFTSLYCLRVDTRITSHYPEIESFLNHFYIRGDLDEKIEKIVNHPRFRPVQRIVRLILNEENKGNAKSFMQKRMSNRAIQIVYEAAMNNNFYTDSRYHDSLNIMGEVLQERNLVEENGFFRKSFY